MVTFIENKDLQLSLAVIQKSVDLPEVLVAASTVITVNKLKESILICYYLFVCGISLTSGLLINELYSDCTRSCFSKVVLRCRETASMR